MLHYGCEPLITFSTNNIIKLKEVQNLEYTLITEEVKSTRIPTFHIII